MIPQRHRRTDGQTTCRGNTALCVASRGKNMNHIVTMIRCCRCSYGSLDVRRKNATRESTSTLKAWLYEHIKNPYPTKGEKIMLAIITKMTLTQVSTWFANARRRLKKENKMQWSPRNRADNDDDDRSTSDDEADTGTGNAKTDDVTTGNTAGTRMPIASKDSDDDIVVDNVGMRPICFVF